MAGEGQAKLHEGGQVTNTPVVGDLLCRVKGLVSACQPGMLNNYLFE